MATQTWIPPLPAGYEARWDPNQRAYFFINHQTKQTTWQDPRYSSRQPAAPTAQAHHQQAAQSLNQYGSGLGGHGGGHGGQGVNMTTMYKQFGGTTTRQQDEDEWESLDSESETELPFSETYGDRDTKVDIAKLHQLKQMYPSAPEDIIKAALTSSRNEMSMAATQLRISGYAKEDGGGSHPPPRLTDMLERLQAMFPSANADLVRDILQASNNDEKNARTQLEAIGYKPKFPETHRASSPARPSPTRASPARAPSPAPLPSPKRATSPAKPKLSAAEKRKLEQKLKAQHKDMDDSVIQMACDVCGYDETRVKAVLERMGDTGSRPSTSTTRTPSPHARSPSPTFVSSYTTEPATFGDDEPSPSSSDTSARPSTSSSRPGTSPSKTTTSRPGTSSSKTSASRPGTSSSTQSRQTQQQRAKHVTHFDVRQPTVTQRQPRAPVYVSENRSPAKGPDPSHHVGPNKDNLLTNYTLAKGSNAELRQGPDASRVQGSQGAVGPDPNIHCGSQYHLRSPGSSPIHQGIGGSPSRQTITAV